MKYTTNAQLKLPDYTDPVDVADINENFTIIDSHLGLFITADGGVHGLRYANGGLEYFNGETWVSAAEVVGAVSEHNSNDTAHSDIRTAVSALTRTSPFPVTVIWVSARETVQDRARIKVSSSAIHFFMSSVILSSGVCPTIIYTQDT